MTPQKRPGLVTAVAIVNLLFGAFGVLGPVCAGGCIGALALLLDKTPPAQPGDPVDPKRDLDEMVQVFRDAGLVDLLIVSATLGLIMSVVLIVSGFGLLKMRRWARALCFVYAVYSILASIGTTAYQMAVVQPAMPKAIEAVQKKRKEEAPRLGPNQQLANLNNMGGGNPAGNLMGVIYGIGLLVVLNLPDVRRAFAEAAAGGVPPVTPPSVEGGLPPPRPPDEGQGRLPSGEDRIQPGGG